MKIIETDYNYIKVPEDAVSLGARPGLGWSGPIAFPTPVRINGHVVSYFNLSSYGAIRFAEAKNGVYDYLAKDTSLPESIFKTDDGYMLVPWGEVQRLRSCGVDVVIFQVGNIICINYKTKSPYGGHRNFMYQVQFDLNQPNQISVHYYHCVSGYNTFVGVVLEPDDYADWQLKPNQPYMKKALRFFTDSDTPDVSFKPEPPQKPLGPPSHVPNIPNVPAPPPNRMPGTTPKTTTPAADTEGWQIVGGWDEMDAEYRVSKRYT